MIDSCAPDLSGIGLRAEPAKIIQSILGPSATITEGYQLQTFVMTDGTNFAGAVLHETHSEVRLVLATWKPSTRDWWKIA